MTKMLIANRLTDGLVVFRTEDSAWAESIAAGQLIAGDTESARLLEQALAEERDNVIIDPCLIDVTEIDGRRVPDSYREEIRATGPSIETGR